LAQWEPVYKLVAPDPDRSPAARNHFASLYRALLAGGFLSEHAHTLLSLLLNESNSKAKSVHRPVWWLAAKLGWGTTKVKAARRECEELGLLVHHNRRGETAQGVRMRPNRYGFTWTYEVIDLAGFAETTMVKHCGAPDVVYLDTVRRQLRRERREAAIASGQAQAERGIALRLVEELITESDNYAQAEAKVRQRFSGDPGLENFAIDHLETEWPRHCAMIEGQQLAMLDISTHSKEQRLIEKYGHRPDLLQLAMAPLTIPARE
jgi:hypothetical protein